MDWTKAKTILIGALIVTNVVLIGVVISNKMQVDRILKVTMETVEVLKKKDIILEAELTFKKEKMSVLAVHPDTYDEEKVQDLIDAQVADPDFADNEKAAKKVADKFIKDCGFMTKNVKLDNCEKINGVYTVTYLNQSKGKQIQPSEMLCQVEAGRVINFNRRWLVPIEYGRTKKAIIPATTALMKFMSEKTENGKVVIEDIAVIYYLDTTYANPANTESDTAFPTWRIRYNGGTEEFILAYETN